MRKKKINLTFFIYKRNKKEQSVTKEVHRNKIIIGNIGYTIQASEIIIYSETIFLI